jgi:hypothetical protein
MSRQGGRPGGSLLPLVLAMTLFGGTTLVVLPLVGQAVAARLGAGHWVWPHQPLQGLRGLLHGHSAVTVAGSKVPTAGAVWYGLPCSG